jgi:sRNA-binding carbon storage regulator CsrA
MLVITLKKDERILTGKDISVTVVQIRGKAGNNPRLRIAQLNQKGN